MFGGALVVRVGDECTAFHLEGAVDSALLASRVSTTIPFSLPAGGAGRMGRPALGGRKGAAAPAAAAGGARTAAG